MSNNAIANLGLSDTSLFRQQAYIDGAWLDADNGATIEVTNPANGEVIGTRAKYGRCRNKAGH